MYNRSIYQA